MPVAAYRHDGYSTYANPATPWIKQLDRPRADAVWAAVVPMIMTFWYTNNQSYAVTAARLLRTFFLNNSTCRGRARLSGLQRWADWRRPVEELRLGW